MFFCEEEGTQSRFTGVKDVIGAHGLFCSLYTDRAFGTHQGRLPKELAAVGITDMDAANAYLRNVYLPAFNAEFAHPSREDGSAFVPCPASVVLDDILGITTPDSVL